MTARWQLNAACRGVDWRVFFTTTRRREALDYCDRYTVRRECLDDAMTAEEGEPARAGIYGGFTALRRKALARVRRQTAGAR
jgi:hypothetical protein